MGKVIALVVIMFSRKYRWFAAGVLYQLFVAAVCGKWITCFVSVADFSGYVN